MMTTFLRNSGITLQAGSPSSQGASVFTVWADQQIPEPKFLDAMVKPKGLIRPIMSGHQVEVAEDGLFDIGNISIDSTGA